MTTIHANTPRDALARLEVMICMAGFDIPMRALRAQVASALQIVIQAKRMPGGKRKVVAVSEITGMEGDQIQMHDLFLFEQSGVGSDGNALGHFICTGLRPRCCERIEHRGIKLPTDLFTRRVIQ
jgi:pilus assembly protein CpaF